MTTANWIPAFVAIPAGASLIGSRVDDPFQDERDSPPREVALSAYLMSIYPTTNQQYHAFIAATGHRPPRHWRQKREESAFSIPDGLEDHPVVNIAWHDADAYAAWLSHKTGHHVVLPTEAQWERAARGPDGNIWPWGDEFQDERCNSAELKLGTTCSVFELTSGASPFGCLHMSGNVWEWCCDFYHMNARQIQGQSEPVLHAPARQRVVKGGSYYYDRSVCRPSARDYTNYSNEGGVDDGFRVCIVRYSRAGRTLPDN